VSDKEKGSKRKAEDDEEEQNGDSDAKRMKTEDEDDSNSRCPITNLCISIGLGKDGAIMNIVLSLFVNTSLSNKLDL